MEIDEQMDVEIRLATIVNYDGVRVEFSGENKFHVELMPEIFQVADPIITSEWYESVLSDPDQTLFAAVIGKDVLGVALVEVKKNLDSPIFITRRYLHIGEIAVAEAHRSQWIGRSLMA